MAAMKNNITAFICKILFGKESDTMIAMLWVDRIIHGKKTYAQVPKLLKEQVKEILIDNGLEGLVTE